MGGQGLHLGVQDTVNLGWKLAQVVNGSSPESLLDTYHAERHPVGARVLRMTMEKTALSRGDERMNALRKTLSELFQMDEPRKRYAGMMSGLNIHYDLGSGHPLLGRRMPDLDVATESSPRRVFTLLYDARPVLLNVGEPGALDITGWADRVRLMDIQYAGAWEFPVLGAVAAPAAMLIRPDGHVAWVGTGTDEASVTRSPPGSDRPRHRSRLAHRRKRGRVEGEGARVKRPGSSSTNRTWAVDSRSRPRESTRTNSTAPAPARNESFDTFPGRLLSRLFQGRNCQPVATTSGLLFRHKTR
jgi:hypothetical protein